jgi:predicted RNA-binding Zn ribbon-like protein
VCVDIDAVPLLGSDATPHEVGSRLCLAAVNTVLWRRGPAPRECLRSYGDLVTLVADAGWVQTPEDLRLESQRHPRLAQRELAAALGLRDQLLTVFSTVAAATPPQAEALRAIEELSARGLARLRLADIGVGYRLHWPDVALDLPVLQLAVSAVLLLASAERDRVKQCPGPTCGWLFLDSTRNRSRRWCDPAECGNRERVKAHYARQKSGTALPHS